MTSPLTAKLREVHRNVFESEIKPFSPVQLTVAISAFPDPIAGPVAPSKDLLARLHHAICNSLEVGEEKLLLSPIEWCDAPWLAFWNWKGRVLYSIDVFREGIAMAAESSAAVRRHCISVYFHNCDQRHAIELALFAEMLRSFVLKGLLPTWLTLHSRYQIFEPKVGPRNVAVALLADAGNRPLHERLNTFGIGNSHIGGGFSRAALSELCRVAHRDPDKALVMIDEWVEMFADRHVVEGEEVLKALLNPWLSTDPDEEWRRALLERLIRIHGDPRRSDVKFWNRISPEFRAVPIRWLVLRTIETFFAVLDQYARSWGDDAMRRQWPYRQAFWLAYYRRGLLLDAKVAVGRDMQERLGWRHLQKRFGTNIAQLEEFEAKQSALLLQLPELIVFVGTQNTSCRLWDEDSLHAPDLRRDVFYRSLIIADPRTDLQVDPDANDTGLRQRGSEKGNWQRKLRDFLWRRVKVFVPDKEFMPL